MSGKTSAAGQPKTKISLKVGDTIQFGRFANHPIEWIVLSVDAHKALLISKFALVCKPYNYPHPDDENRAVTWESCCLRHWLTYSFQCGAFNEEELAMILTSTVTADRNPQYPTNPGNDTNDKIFLLSIPEAEKYFSTDDARRCKFAPYAASGDAAVDSEGYCTWRLRSPGKSSTQATFVDLDGTISYYGGGDDSEWDDNATFPFWELITTSYVSIRPSLWLNLDALYGSNARKD